MNKKILAAAVMGTALIFTACGNTAADKAVKQQTSGTLKHSADADVSYEKAFGSYDVPGGWIEAESYSTEEKAFYVADGTENERYPDNVSINTGTNKYAKDDHLQFRDAITAQLAMQLQGHEDALMEASGGLTEKGDILYTFVIKEEESGVVTTQYYIVGDHRYALVHETNYSASADADKAAKTMVNSFAWKE